MFPGNANDTPGFGAGYKKTVRDYAGAFISMGGFGEVLARYENQVLLDPVQKDKWGIPVLRFNYKFGENEKKMCEDMAVAAQEMFELAGFEILNVDRAVLTEGWSIRARPAWARQEDVRAEPVSAVARREEPVRGRWQQPRQRLVPEPDLDDHGAGLALVRAPRRRIQEGEPVMADDHAPGEGQAPAISRRVRASVGGPNRSEFITAIGRAPMVKMSRRIPPTPVAAP
jgi:hypothetical protein